MSNPRGQCSGQHIGTQTHLYLEEPYGSPLYSAVCEEYNGSSWTSVVL